MPGTERLCPQEAYIPAGICTENSSLCPASLSNSFVPFNTAHAEKPPLSTPALGD